MGLVVNSALFWAVLEGKVGRKNTVANGIARIPPPPPPPPPPPLPPPWLLRRSDTHPNYAL